AKTVAALFAPFAAFRWRVPWGKVRFSGGASRARESPKSGPRGRASPLSHSPSPPASPRRPESHRAGRGSLGPDEPRRAPSPERSNRSRAADEQLVHAELVQGGLQVPPLNREGLGRGGGVPLLVHALRQDHRPFRDSQAGME